MEPANHRCPCRQSSGAAAAATKKKTVRPPCPRPDLGPRATSWTSSPSPRPGVSCWRPVSWDGSRRPANRTENKVPRRTIRVTLTLRQTRTPYSRRCRDTDQPVVATSVTTQPAYSVCLRGLPPEPARPASGAGASQPRADQEQRAGLGDRRGDRICVPLDPRRCRQVWTGCWDRWGRTSSGSRSRHRVYPPGCRSP
jgi:hypothetical protein